MTRIKRVLNGIVAGMASTANIYEKKSFPSLGGSDIDRIRADVSRIGNDFRTVVNREYAKKNTAR